MKKFFVALFVAVSFHAYAYAPAGAGFALYIPDSLDCAGSQCKNIWGECFMPVYDADGIANVDTMPKITCRPEKAVLLTAANI